MTKIYSLSRRKAIYVAMLLTISFTACDKFPPMGDGDAPRTIFQTIASEKKFSLLTAAVVKAKLVETLNDKKNSLTLFAPTDDAFRAAGFKEIKDINNVSEETLKSILLYHVLGSEIKSTQIPQAANTEVATVAGKPVFVTRTAMSKVFVNGVTVINKDIDCTNGVIHVVNRVLMASVGTIVQTCPGEQ